MWGANRLLTRFQERSSVRMKTTFGLVGAADARAAPRDPSPEHAASTTSDTTAARTATPRNAVPCIASSNTIRGRQLRAPEGRRLEDRAGDALRVVDHRHVAGAREHREAGFRQAPPGHPGVEVDGQQGIVG